MRHADLVGDEAIHQAAYVQTSDPGAVGAKKLWIDITDPDAVVFKVRNDADSGWTTYTPVANVASLDDLTDVILTTPGTGAVLMYDGADWIDVVPVLDDLGDVIITSPATGAILKYNGSAWIDSSLALEDLSNVVITSVADGDVPTWDAGTSKWVNAAGGGGGGASEIYPDSAPASPNSHDDEFTTSSLDADWTETATPDGSITTDPDEYGTHLSFKSPGVASNNQRILRKAVTTIGAAGTAIGISAKMSLSGIAGTVIFDFGVSDNSTFATGNYTLFTLKLASATANAVEMYDGASNGTTTLPTFVGTVYFHVQRSTGNTLKVFVSLDGFGWKEIYSGSKTFNMDYCWIRQYGSTSSGQPSELRMDFIRFNDPRFTQQV